MNKKFISTGLLVTLLSGYMPISSFADESVNKDTIENLKVYRKTSKTPGEEINKFGNFGYFHTNEPLGIEVMEKTEIDILISGKKVSGKAVLKLHDVDDIQYIQEVEVGKKTTIKIPRKGQLFLDVANVKLDDNDKYKDFEIDIKLTMDKKDYKITPIFDMRENKISDKNNLTEEKFLEKAFSEENKEDGALMISENIRLYIPKSKYIPDYLDPDKVMDFHEQTIEVYNEIAGLDIKAKDEADRPRENFILVSAANNQIGYMSAGNDMLDTHTSNIHTYLNGGDTSKDNWGQSHEYGHKYESPWGYQEHWCNVFANTLDRIIYDNPERNWLYGSKGEEGYMRDIAKASYDSYLKNGEVKAIHPLYLFINFIDKYDKDYASEMSRQSLDIPYGGADYVAVFAAKNYNINIIPYLEMCGEQITNEEAIDYVLENSNSTYMYMPEYDFMNEYNDISQPPTVRNIYTGENRILSGMSNKNSTITIDINGEKTQLRTDENGKFEFKIPNNLNLDDTVKVSSKEDGKSKSFDVDVKLINKTARVSFKGYKNEEFLSLTLDGKNNKFKAKSSGKVANEYIGGDYAVIEQYNKKGKLKNKLIINSNSNADNIANKLNEMSYIDGDYIKLKHVEQYGRLSIDGEIKNSPFKLSSGVRDLDLSNSYFYILDDNLVYSDKKLDLAANKDDLKELINSIDLQEKNYTKTTWANFEENLENAKIIILNENASKEEVSATYELLKSSIDNLRKINIVEFKGYNNNVFLKLGFDTENNTFEAVSNGQVANAYSNGEYASITHYDKKGNVKGKYSVDADSNADEVVKQLNNLSYSKGDYLKFNHKEKNNRLVVSGYIENTPSDLSNGVGNLDLTNSYFYLTGENLEYSNEQLDLSASKEELIVAIQKAMGLDAKTYTKSSYEKLQTKINEGQIIVNTANVTEEEVQVAIDNIEKAVSELKELNKIEFRGYNNEVFLSLEFDTENNRFKAISNGKIVHPYQYSREYVKVSHYDQKGNLKGEYSVNADQTADKMAEELNKAKFVKGDYIKLNHLEKNNRLVIDGYVENAPYDLGTGAYDLDLSTAIFYLGENLAYSAEQLDLSADKTVLIEKINEAKAIEGTNYTKTSYNHLQGVIKKAEELVKATNIYENEISEEIEKLETAISELKELNTIVFEGMDNKESLKLSFDSENKKFKAVSNGETIHPYQGANYFKITHYDKKGNVKGTYSASGSNKADDMASKLNEVVYVDGDYLKLHHGEQNNRLEIEGYIENAPSDLSNGVGNLDLINSYFYLTGENLSYATEQLDLSANKEKLIETIEKGKSVDRELYTKSSYKNLQNKINEGQIIVNTANVTEEEVQVAIDNIEKAVSELKELNKIEFRGYNEEVFLSLEFDTENNRFKAISNGKIVHPYQYSREYVKVSHYDQKGNLKGEYSVNADQTADKMAEELNKAKFVKGDYIKLNHLEKNNRLVIDGYVENAPYDLGTGAYDLDLSTAIFYLGENLAYSAEQLDLSADKTLLIEKINEAKAIEGTNYTKTSYNHLQDVIKKAEELIKATNIYENEISEEIEKLETAISELKELNTIVFEGMDNKESLKLSFDSENKKFKAVSNGETIHPYQGANYFKITHYDKKGNVKGTYSASGSNKADDMASKLNEVVYVDGDYLKLHHGEQNNRLEIEGYIENAPSDLSNGVGNLDLTNSYFYLTGENLSYATEQLDLSANKENLIVAIQKAMGLDAKTYTKSSYEKLQTKINEGQTIANTTNVTEEEVQVAIDNIEKAISELKELNKIEFKGYNNEVFLSLEFDTENNRFKAISNGKIVHPYQYSREYVKVSHYDQKGNLKGEYSVNADQTADKMAEELNKAKFVKGDYIKLNHLEKNNRLVIDGYVENAPYDLGTGAYDLDLSTAIFYLGENLAYSAEQLDLSADKTLLIEKINEAKAIEGTNYTKTSYNHLQDVIKKAEELVKAANIYENEINEEIENITNSIENLREVNVIEFKGYNNEVFMTLSVNKETNKFEAVSSSKTIHPYQYSNLYATVYHYDKEGNLKAEYSVKANETADKMASELNQVSINEGDYIKLYHLEQGNRLTIKGYINNLETDLSNGVGNLDLSNTIFNLDDENLSYINIQ